VLLNRAVSKLNDELCGAGLGHAERSEGRRAARIIPRGRPLANVQNGFEGVKRAMRLVECAAPVAYDWGDSSASCHPPRLLLS
jgi:hypothetical protein